MSTGTDAALTWNLGRDLTQLFEFHFMVNAFRAGTVVAIVAAAIGWYTVLRRETFAGHTLSVIGFPGATAAVWLGLSASVGFYAFCISAALLIAALPRHSGDPASEESAVIGTIQAFALACGFLFVSLYGGFLYGTTSLLFGSFLGITDREVVTLVVVGAAAVVTLALVARPLLFASIDANVAGARGLPSRALATAFLVLLGVAVAAASQITGALLVFALLVMPAATAQVLTARPAVSFALAIGLALAITWLGLAIAYYSPYPVGFWITTIAFVAYLGARVSRVRV
jgi:zinc/manganese transport system permease protein